MFRQGLGPVTDYMTVSGVLRHALGFLQFNHLFQELVYGTSTAYGLPFCYRRAGLLILGMILVLRVLPLQLTSWHEVKSPLRQALHFLILIHHGLTLVSVLGTMLFQVA